jgi:hypothetical protein
MVAVRQQRQFSPRGASARYRFGQETFAESRATSETRRYLSFVEQRSGFRSRPLLDTAVPYG